MLERPRVGMGILARKGEKVLMIRRKHSHEKGTWAPPGGHLEFGESLEECAIRKVREETGLIVTDPRFLGITNDLFEGTGRHYVTIWMEARYVSGEPVIGSAREISAAGWYAWDKLPTPFFLTFKNVMRGTDAYGFEALGEIRSKFSEYYLSEFSQ